MDDIINLFDGLVKYSSQQYKASLPSAHNSRWKYCVMLSKCGWKAVGFKNLDGDGISVIWSKEGQDNISIDLSFTEQCIWLKFMDNEEKKNVK